VEGSFRELINVLSQNMLGGAEGHEEKLEHSVTPAEIREKYLPDTYLNCYHCANLLGTNLSSRMKWKGMQSEGTNHTRV
jgi:hypothetical protein